MALRQYLEAFVNLIYPMHCFGCRMSLHNEGGRYLCKGCWGGISYITGTRCPRCGMGLGDYALISQEGCIECRTHRFKFDGAFSAAYYEGVIKELIHQFKYGRQEFLAESLTEVLARCVKEIDLRRGNIDMVVAVPLHRRKMTERGFNQAELLGRNVGRFLDMDVCTGGLRRVRNTPSQTRLPYYKREENVREAFLVEKPTQFKGKDVLLVDDVLTSGLTASECARVLKESGARRVYVLTVAKSRRMTARV
ncbi:MAG: ComF family protein [Candidatus Brocadiales bacterium]